MPDGDAEIANKIKPEETSEIYLSLTFSFCSTYYCYFNICNRYNYHYILLLPEAHVLYSLHVVQGSTESNWQVMCTATTGTSQINDASLVLVCLQMHGLASLVVRYVTALPSLTPLDVPKHIAKPRYCCSVCSKQFTTSSGLQIHEDGHLGRYRYRCTFCGKGFAATTNTCLFTLVSSSSSVLSVAVRSAMKEITVAT